MANELSGFAAVFLLGLVALGLVFALLLVGRLLRMKNLPCPPNKLMTYECGEVPVGAGQVRFNVRFYIVALVFVLFDVEMVLVYPIVQIFRSAAAGEGGGTSVGWFLFAEFFFFIIVLLLGLVYVWRRGDLGFIRTYRRTE